MPNAMYYKVPVGYDKRNIASLDLDKLKAYESFTIFQHLYPWGFVVGEDVQLVVVPQVADVHEGDNQSRRTDAARPRKRVRITQDEDCVDSVDEPLLIPPTPFYLASAFLLRLRKMSKLLPESLPSVEELPVFFNAPLEDSEKIPISQELFNYAFSGYQGFDMCTKEDVSAVFKVGDTGPASLSFIRVLDSPPLSRTEAGYHHCWDDNIRNILQLLIPEGECIRHSNYHTETRNSLPDLGYLINKRCVFRGEEKGPTSPGNPALELVRNIVWEYDSAPYILGILLSAHPENIF
ncbi:hypothetical protein BDP27DRAFT_266718 [Rhodocollybia butyracea]|uniref:Uncharacterized protein n=1 Tax=Rhodocollybia butyracea TaxID=206335 RepID=A0A9P5PWJ4_9AGAR|nr:hypothetical protein BDP27DRAFT_266718 [Rhodocollybia butyracea]